MNREKTLFKNTIIITVGKICTQLITFFLLPLYTSVLSTEEYGTVDLLNTLVSLLLPIVTFQVEQAVFRKLIDNRDKERHKRNIISTGIFSVIIQCVIYLCVFMAIAPFVNNEYKYFLATNVIAYIFASLMQQIARGLGNNTKYAIGSFVSALTTILCNILFLVVFKFGANGMLMANMLGQIMCTIYYIFALKLYKYISYRAFKKNLLKKLWNYSIPLIPNAISWWVFNASNRVIVSSILGVAKNGIFSAAYKFSSVYITLYNIFNLSWTESVSLHIDDKDAKEFLNNMINTMLKFFVAMGIGIIACMPFVYPIMINSNYAEGYNQVPIMMLGSIFNVVVGLISTIYVAKKNTKAIASTSIVSAIINIAVHLALIKFIGLYAASIATLTSYFVMSIYRLHDIKKKYFKINIEKKFILATIIALIPILLAYYSENIIFYAIGLLIAIIYAGMINRKNIKAILAMVLKKKQGESNG